MTRRDPGLKSTLVVQVSTALKTALELEAWECQMTLPEYIRGLLSRRGKWARSTHRLQGYDIQSDLPLRAQRREQ